jgi:hypothetical protein
MKFKMTDLEKTLALALQNLLNAQDNIPPQLIRNSQQYVATVAAARELLKEIKTSEPVTWVGLTYGQKKGILEEYNRSDNSIIPTPEALIKVVESILKEKNT